MSKEIICTRFAPSPTGRLHVGGARTALFNWLFARKMGGEFVLRIEDTDVERCKPEHEREIFAALHYLGMDWNEGPDVGGPYGPYRQSERAALYAEAVARLKAKGVLYPCYCSEEDLAQMKADAMARGVAFRYDRRCLHLSDTERARMEGTRRVPCWRLRVPSKEIAFDDLFHGRLRFAAGEIGDFVVVRSNGVVTYNFAVVVDDLAMEISHVLRADEHVSNTPRQVALYEVLEAPMPRFGHFSMILGQDRSKLSKRHGSTAVMDYIADGYLPEALNNALALIGWSPKIECETFASNELRKVFSLDGINTSPGIFDPQKLLWMNGWHIRHLPVDDLVERCLPFLTVAKVLTPDLHSPASGEAFSHDYVKSVIALEQERLKKLSEISELVDYFFIEMPEYPVELLAGKGMVLEDAARSIEIAVELVENTGEISQVSMATAFRAASNLHAIKYGFLLWPVRAALSGRAASPGCFELIEVLGREKALHRLKNAQVKLLSTLCYA